eukprot:scaffold8447_cov26-Tisochrysis_lutea.AAC.1
MGKTLPHHGHLLVGRAGGPHGDALSHFLNGVPLDHAPFPTAPHFVQIPAGALPWTPGGRQRQGLT